ncbi:MAG: SDR family oxidoreductase [Proteobacteria bacterium]|nr:SDR family oxidoreductase [Pseudomonadota bacterium]
MSDGEHAGRVALVTGAAGGGIGLCTAHELAGQGAAVALNVVSPRRTAEVEAALQSEFGPRVRGYCFDVTDRTATDEGLDRIARELGPVDILVNNAAINLLGRFSEYAPEDWDRVIAADCTACFYLIRKLLPGMLERGRGSIVNVSSVASYQPGGGLEGAYASAKAAVNAITRTVAQEGGPRGVRCNGVAPGLVRTAFIERHLERLAPQIERIPLGRMAEPAEIAGVIAFLCSGRASYITGETLTVSGGLYMRA